MREDPIETLKRFTPTAPDAAAMLFAAGKASAQSHFWKGFVVVLMVVQCLTLGLWWYSSRAYPVVEVQLIEPPPVLERSDPVPFEAFSYAALNRGEQPRGDGVPDGIPEDSKPPLTPFSAHRPNRN